MINKNELPKNWEMAKVNDIALNIQYGYTESSSAKEVGPKFLRITDIQENRVNWKNVPYCKISEDAKGKYKLQDGDLVFARTGATVGKSFLIKGEIPEAVFASYLIRLRFPKTVLDKFVYNFFQSHLYWKQIVEGQVGIGQPNVNGTKLGQLLLPLPPLAEQERIVAKIEELFSELDAGIESLKTAQAQLKTYRQAVLKYAFEGKLTNENVKEGELPKGWKWEKLLDVTEKISDGPFGSNLKSVDYIDEGVRVVRLENIGVLEFKDQHKTYVSEEKYLTISRHTVTKGDIIFSSFIADEIRVTILPDYIEKAINKADCFCIRTAENKINRKFLCFFLATKTLYNQLINEVHGATRPRINTTQLKSSIVPTCSLEEQQRIVEEIESRLSVCDKLEETIAASLKQSEALRQSILKKAFEGKLV